MGLNDLIYKVILFNEHEKVLLDHMEMALCGDLSLAFNDNIVMLLFKLMVGGHIKVLIGKQKI